MHLSLGGIAILQRPSSASHGNCRFCSRLMITQLMQWLMMLPPTHACTPVYHHPQVPVYFVDGVALTDGPSVILEREPRLPHANQHAATAAHLPTCAACLAQHGTANSCLHAAPDTPPACPGWVVPIHVGGPPAQQTTPVQTPCTALYRS